MNAPSSDSSSSAPDAPAASSRANGRMPRRRIPWIPIITISLLASAVLWWWQGGRETTDNARLEGHVHPVAARIDGTVVEVLVEDNQHVESGAVLFELDVADYELALERARADHAVAVADEKAAAARVPVESTSATSHLEDVEARVITATSEIDASEQAAAVARALLSAARASQKRAEAAATTAKVELERLEPLISEQQVSQQEFDRARTAALSTEAAAEGAVAQTLAAESEVVIADRRVEQARQQLRQAQAALREARRAPERIEASVASAQAAIARARQAEVAVKRAELDLEYTRIESPATGTVARKRVEVGQRISAGQPVLALVADDGIWVEANFKENQIRKMRPGQPATVEVDAYPGETFRGHVSSLGAATASRFSLLPADNASGNFVKVVQRIPIRIAIDRTENEDLVLRPGMSVVVTVHVRRAPVLPDPAESATSDSIGDSGEVDG